MKFIPIADALTTTGHPTPAAFDRWCRRYAERFPDGPAVLRRYGAVEQLSLERALEHETTARAERLRRETVALTESVFARKRSRIPCGKGVRKHEG